MPEIENLKSILSYCLFTCMIIASISANAQCLHELPVNPYIISGVQGDQEEVNSLSAGDTWFKDVSLEMGIVFEGISFGSSWGDINNDGYPDLFTGNHGTPIVYYNNQGDGFTEEYLSFYQDTLYFHGFDSLTQEQLDTIDPALVDTFVQGYDFHGCSFVDFDNDGDADIYSNMGARGGYVTKSNVLFENIGSHLEIDNTAINYALNDEFGRGRGLLWFDQNNDGELDLFLCNVDRADGKGQSTLMLREGETFADKLDDIQLDDTNLEIAKLNTSGDSKNLRLLAIASNTIQTYDYSSFPFKAWVKKKYHP